MKKLLGILFLSLLLSGNSFAGVEEVIKEIKKNKDFSVKREEILEMIWNMEEEIMGKDI